MTETDLGPDNHTLKTVIELWEKTVIERDNLRLALKKVGQEHAAQRDSNAALVEALERVNRHTLEPNRKVADLAYIIDAALTKTDERGQQIMAVVELALKAAGSGYATQDRLALNNALAELDK